MSIAILAALALAAAGQKGPDAPSIGEPWEDRSEYSRDDTVPPVPLGDNPATIYIFRHNRFVWLHRTADITIDGWRAGSLITGGCAKISVAPGRHNVAIGWPFNLLTLDQSQPPAIAPVDLEPGKTYVFRFDVRITGACQAGYNQVCYNYAWGITRDTAMDQAALDRARCKPMTLREPRPGKRQAT